MAYLVTVVTPCFNSEETIEATIKSVLSQTYPHIEYMVMDGGSNDGTVEIIRKYAAQLKFVSEKDKGQADAINKGWKAAQGEIVAWLNADDQYQPDTVAKAVEYFELHPEAMWLYGTAESIDESGAPFPYRNYRDDWDYQTLVTVGSFINQPSVFLRRQLLDEFGYLDESLQFCMDYEYWLRIGRTYPAHYVPSVKTRIIRARTTKTESGGVPRLLEAEAVAKRYGAVDLPRGAHHEWGWIFAERGFHHLRRARWKEAFSDFKQIWRYPSTLHRSLMKLFIRAFVPRAIETRLRQWFVH